MWDSSEALVIASTSRNRIDVHLTGTDPTQRQELIGIIRTTIAEIHGQLPKGLVGLEELGLEAARNEWKPVPDMEVLNKAEKQLQVIVNQVPQMVDVAPELQRIRPDIAVSANAPRARVFISYAHLDSKYCKRFQSNLRILENQGLVRPWQDGMLKPDQDWDQHIRHEAKHCDIVVFLITTHFLASGYCTGVEMKLAQLREQKGECRILPVYVEQVEGASYEPWLGKMNGCPRINGRIAPIVGFNPNQSAGWNEVTKQLRQMVSEMDLTRPDKLRWLDIK